MKYTNYLMKKKLFHLEYLETDVAYLKPISITSSIFFGIIGMSLLSSLLIMTVPMDTARYAKLQFIKKYYR